MFDRVPNTLLPPDACFLSSTHKPLGKEFLNRSNYYRPCTAQNMIFSTNEFFSKGEEIRSFLQIWSHLLKKSLIENFVSLCSVTRIVGLTNTGLGNSPFHTNGLFLYPLETLENQKHLGALKRHRKRPLA